MIGEAAVLHHARYGAPSNLDFAVSRWGFIPGFEREMIAAHPKKFRHSKGKFEINPDNSTDWVVINLISIDMLPFHPSSMVPFGTVSPNDIPIMPIHELVSLEAACCSCQGTEFVEQAAVHAGNVFALLKSPPQAVSLLGLMTARQIEISKISAYRLSLLHFDTGWTELLRTDDIGEFAHSMMDIQR